MYSNENFSEYNKKLFVWRTIGIVENENEEPLWRI
jgi:hypothetical protein